MLICTNSYEQNDFTRLSKNNITFVNRCKLLGHEYKTTEKRRVILTPLTLFSKRMYKNILMDVMPIVLLVLRMYRNILMGVMYIVYCQVTEYIVTCVLLSGIFGV